MKTLSITALLLLATAAGALAETRYVSDVVYIPVRSGAGNEFRVIHSGLRSGTRVNVLETEGEWAHIETDELDGWMRSQYLTDQPTARMHLNEARARLENLQQENAQLNETLRELRQTNEQLSARVAELETQAGEATEELQRVKNISSDAMQLHEQHQQLLEKHQMLQTANDTLRAENDRLKSDRTINKWLYGAGLIIAGMLLAVILPALKPRKRYSDWA